MNKNKKQILMFDANLVLVGLFNSYYSASQATGICHQMIIKACSGQIIAARNFYWRELNPEYIIDTDDLGSLTLIQYDKNFGINREIYATKFMRKNEIIWESDYDKRYSIIRQRQKEKWNK